MASIKQLKKEIEFLSAQVIDDCIDLVQTFSGKEKEALEVIDTIISLHHSTIDMLNHPDGKDNPKLVKAFYKQLRISYMDGINEAYKQLEELVK